MYTPESFENKKIDKIHQFIEQFSFATLISQDDDDLQVSHLPLMLEREQGSYGSLIGHMAKLNPHLNLFDGEKTVLCIFHGPHAYISPAWYKNSPSVPTWNYTVVHVIGIPTLVSADQLSADLTKMTKLYESQLAENPRYVIPENYKQTLINHIVGFKIEIKQIKGKFKLGQNRSLEDQKGMLKGLQEQNSNEAICLANFIQSMS